MIDEIEIEDFLEHFGVKGMRWGVRKKLQVASDRHRINVEAKYIKKGVSGSELQKRVNGRLRTEKILAAAGGVALTAAVGYVAKQEAGKRFTSVLLKEGTELKYINALGDKADLDRRLYTSFTEKDTKKYRGLLAKSLQANAADTKIYETVLTAKTEIKAPSHREAAKIFKELQKSGKLDVRESSYKIFNQGLVEDTRHGKAFFAEMSRRGYNAVLDSNDQFVSGYNAKKPLILFNAASTTVKTGQKIVDQNTINGLYKKQLAGVLVKQFTPMAAMGAAAVSVNVGLESNTKHAAVNRHLAKNPQSTESPSMIFARLQQTPTGNYVVKK